MNTWLKVVLIHCVNTGLERCSHTVDTSHTANIDVHVIHVGVRETLKRPAEARQQLNFSKIVDSDAKMAGTESGENFEVKLNAKVSLQGLNAKEITVKTRANSSWRRCSNTLSQHLDREVFIRLNTSWSRC